MSVIDQLRDPTLARLVRLVANRPKIAELVKEADVLPEELDTLPNHAFAWEEKRAFPIHTPEHTAMSRLYREDHRGPVPRAVDDRLKEASDIYGLDEKLFDKVKVAAVADDPDDFLLPEQKRLPVKTAAQVKVAEEKLLAGYQKLSVESRALACKRLLEKAAQFNVTLNPLMHKLAGYTVTSTEKLASWLEARKEAAKEPVFKDAFQKLADATKQLPVEVRNREDQIKLAQVISDLDVKAGLVRHYDRRLPDPLQTVFNTDKIAGLGVDLNGRFVSMSRLASYPSTFYSDALGPDLVREASDGHGGIDPQKLAAIIETLPRDMKSVLSRVMQ